MEVKLLRWRLTAFFLWGRHYVRALLSTYAILCNASISNIANYSGDLLSPSSPDFLRSVFASYTFTS